MAYGFVLVLPDLLLNVIIHSIRRHCVQPLLDLHALLLLQESRGVQFHLSDLIGLMLDTCIVVLVNALRAPLYSVQLALCGLLRPRVQRHCARVFLCSDRFLPLVRRPRWRDWIVTVALPLGRRQRLLAGVALVSLGYERSASANDHLCLTLRVLDGDCLDLWARVAPRGELSAALVAVLSVSVAESVEGP